MGGSFFAIRRSAWLTVHLFFFFFIIVRCLEVSGGPDFFFFLVFARAENCLLKNAFSIFNCDMLSVLYTLCIFLCCTSEVLFALHVMQFDNVL